MTTERRALAAFSSDLPVPSDGPGIVRASMWTLFKWKRVILTVTAVFTLAGCLYLLVRPATVSATARLLLVTNPGQTAPVLRAEAARLMSREVLGPVARALVGEDGGGSELAVLLDAKLAELQARTDARPVAETNMIQITHTAPPADDPIRTLRLIVERYVAAYSGTTASQALVAYATEEHARIVGDVHRREEELDRWRSANSIVSIDSAITSQLELLAQRETALRDVGAEMDAVKSKITAVERQLPSHPAQVSLQREQVSNPVIATLQAELATAEAAAATDRNTPLVLKLKGDLVAAELALHELRQRYTDKDRRVQEKQDHLAVLRREVEAAEADATRNVGSRITRLKEQLAAAQSHAEITGRQTIGLNPVRGHLDTELAGAVAHLAFLGARHATLASQATALRDSLSTLRAKKLEDDRLSTAITLGRDLLQVSAKKRDEARLTAGAQNELSRLSVIIPPYQQPRPGLLTQLNIAALSFVAGLMVSSGLAFAYEFSRNALRSRQDVEYYLAVPLLAAIPERTES